MPFKCPLRWFAFWRHFRASTCDLHDFMQDPVTDPLPDPSMSTILRHLSSEEIDHLKLMFTRWSSLGAQSNAERYCLSLLIGRQQFVEFDDTNGHVMTLECTPPASFSLPPDTNTLQLTDTWLNTPIARWLVATFPAVMCLEIELTNQCCSGCPAVQCTSILNRWSSLVQLTLVLDDGHALRRLIGPINRLSALKVLSLSCTESVRIEDHELPEPLDRITIIGQLLCFAFSTEDTVGVVLNSLERYAGGNRALSRIVLANSVDDTSLNRVLQLDPQVASTFVKLSLQAPTQLTIDALYNLAVRFNSVTSMMLEPLPSGVSLYQLAHCLEPLRTLKWMYVELVTVEQLTTGLQGSIYSIPRLSSVTTCYLHVDTTRHRVLNSDHLYWIFPSAQPAVQFTYLGCTTCHYADGRLLIDRRFVDKCIKQQLLTARAF